MSQLEVQIEREALMHYRAMWNWNLTCLAATDAERQLAALKIQLIDAALSK